MSIIGNRIREIRGKRTQSEFGALLGVDRTTVGSWEIGRHEPNIELLCQIADMGSVSLDWLTGHSKFHTYAEEQSFTNPKWQVLIRLADHHKLSPKQICTLIQAGLDLNIHL